MHSKYEKFYEWLQARKNAVIDFSENPAIIKSSKEISGLNLLLKMNFI